MRATLILVLAGLIAAAGCARDGADNNQAPPATASGASTAEDKLAQGYADDKPADDYGEYDKKEAPKMDPETVALPSPDPAPEPEFAAPSVRPEDTAPPPVYKPRPKRKPATKHMHLERVTGEAEARFGDEELADEVDEIEEEEPEEPVELERLAKKVELAKEAAASDRRQVAELQKQQKRLETLEERKLEKKKRRKRGGKKSLAKDKAPDEGWANDEAEGEGDDEDDDTRGPESGELRSRLDGKAQGGKSASSRDLGRLAALLEGRGKLAGQGQLEGKRREIRPTRFLPSFFYFENTYLGGDAGYLERVRRLDEALGEGAPYHMARAYAQPFDAPGDAGLALSATLDRTWVDRPGRVFLQVGLQGSGRYGWRRPPLDLVVVLDRPGASDKDAQLAWLTALLRQLGPRDRLGLLVVGHDEPVSELDRLRHHRTDLPSQLGRLERSAGDVSAGALERALAQAGAMLRKAAAAEATVPGSQTVLLVTAGQAPDRVAAAQRGAHALTVQGAVTSVVEVGDTHTGAWWGVASAGHGNYHRFGRGAEIEAVQAELDALSRVVARLIRVNVKLAPGVKAIRVLGSRKLEEEEVKRVKAREVAIDRNLSKTLGVKADRGEDDDGIQTVIPYFYGADSHVVVIELWVEEPGQVADVSLRYKDMVNVSNAAAQVAVSLGTSPERATPAQEVVARNVRGLTLAEELVVASQYLSRGQRGQALDALATAAQLAETRADREMVGRFVRLVRDSGQGGAQTRVVSDALALAGARKVGLPAR